MRKTLIKIQKFFFGKIIERVNKFIVKAEINNKIIFAHLNNTGRLEEFVKRGKVGVFLPIKGKKTKFRLSMIVEDIRTQHGKDTDRTDKNLISQFSVSKSSISILSELSVLSPEKSVFASIIDTSLQMKCFEIALEKGYLKWLKGAKILKRNHKIHNTNGNEYNTRMATNRRNISLIDYLIKYKNKNYLLEVKSAVMKKGIYAMYPDCPSIRGQKHIKELINIQLLSSSSLVSNSANSASVQRDFASNKNVRIDSRNSSHKFASIILFIAGMKDIKAFKPNKDADPKIYELLKIAKQKGVKIKAIQIYFDLRRKEIVLKNDDLKVEI